MARVQGRPLTPSSIGTAEPGLAVRVLDEALTWPESDMPMNLAGDRKRPIAHVDANGLFRTDVPEILPTVSPSHIRRGRVHAHTLQSARLGT